MFSLSPVGYVFTGEGSLYGIEQLDSIVNHVGTILCYKMNRLFEDRDYCITYFKGLSSEYLAKSVGFEIKSELLAQNIGNVRFEVRSSEDFPGSFDLKVRVGRLGSHSKVRDFSTNKEMLDHTRSQAKAVLVTRPHKETTNSHSGDSDHAIEAAALEYLAMRGVCCL